MQNLFSPLEKIYKALYLFAYDITGNYGLALILLSFFTFIVLYPFNKKAQQIQNKEHKVQAILAPQISEIKKQYSGREQYEQLQWLYRRYGYHPLYAIRSALGLLLQIPFLTAAYYMLSGLAEIQGVSWGMIQNLGSPDHLLHGVNVLPFVMTLVTAVYAFVIPDIRKKERLQTVVIGVFFLVLLYSAPSALLIFWTCNLVWSLLDSVLCEKLAWIGDYVTDNELAFHIIFVLALTVGLLVPLDIYIKNANQLWFDLEDIGKYFIQNTAKYVGILFLVYFVCWRRKIRYIYLSVLMGLLLGIFLQSYIIGINYGTFDGHEINWNAYTVTGVINSMVWLLCLSVPVIFFYKFKFDAQLLKRFVKPVSFFIIVIQCIVLLVTLKNNPIQKDIVYQDGKAGILTTKNMYTISTKENIIIFLLDAFDASVFEEIQEKNPEVIREFKDFTYYPDTTSSHGYTYYSLPEILTGGLYGFNDSYSNYIYKAWKDNPYYSTLIEKNYLINLYTSGRFVDKSAPISNLTYETVTMNKDTAERFNIMAKFRLMPHFFKRFYYYGDMNILDPNKYNVKNKPYETNDLAFAEGIQRGLNTTHSRNIFQFYHLNGLHEPFILNEEAKLAVKGESNYYKQALGALKIVRNYMMQMKRLKKYENAVIAVIADHGQHNTIGSRPLFIIKPQNTKNTDLIIDKSPMTVADLLPVVFSRNHELAAITFSKKTDDYKRYFYYEDIKNKRMLKYVVNSPAANRSSWVLMTEVPKIPNLNHNYVIGEIIDFSFDGNSRPYKGSGWREKEDWEGTLIAKDEAELIVNITDLSEIKKNLLLKIIGSAYLESLASRKVKVYVNDSYVGEFEVDNKVRNVTCDNTKNVITIPKSVVLSQTPIRVRFLVETPAGPLSSREKELVVMIEKCQFVKN